MKKIAPIALVLVGAMSLTACTTTERTVAGAAIGAGAGAVVGGAVAGTPGAVVGGVAGGATGAVIGRNSR
ncbi:MULTISPECIES: YMGG-like glycine zipper-containing protein [unclassified Devosia]|jgi:predicted small secreted protein|uniref:YMGG-like glycine zipper-containing protein n=1 Tax=unclassified Devosia TaxID=196773 RepID=UPI000FD98A69|nr:MULTISPECIES: YMGG-like glycine zipper-containing protein [unclassified Devosia]